MTLTNFIRENRNEIDGLINAELFRHDGNGGHGTIPHPPPQRNDSERADWVRNDEGLYNWARSEGVRAP